ncbi:GntR family transcriptional regulator [Nocardioides sp.]|uniref:FadR/GntR family transcriptional regulator n=1 Tax=Nocardioides sp. TaxID=35761 RepID=UPI00286E9547|nr:GntR family transcriptional regulator [Nocardioides sp.]
MNAARATDHLGDVVLRQVRGHHAFEGCVEQLATTIRLGVYPYGSPLPTERDLAERLGVSRATLREAIAGLRQAGMVSTTRGRGGGTVVSYRPEAPASSAWPGVADRKEELLDSLTFRRIVEPGACYVAANRALSASERMLLTTSLAAVDDAADSAAHRQADSRLHLAIASVAASPMTIASVTEVQACLHDMLQAIPVLEVNIEHSTRQHQAIVTAILAGEATRARRAMEHHCDDTAALLRGLLG